MKRFKDFFTSDHNPRWQIMLAGGFVIFAAWAQNFYFYSQQISRENQLAEQQQVEDKSVEIQRHSIEFQTYAGAFVSAILDQQDDVQVRRSLLNENILAQDAAVDVSSYVFDADTAVVVAKYRSALRQMNVAVSEAHDVLSMGPFWEAASDLLVARNELLDALEKQASRTGS